jgi:hypothetical protein
MARKRRRVTGNAYQKRPVAGSPSTPHPGTDPPDQLTSGEAHKLADRIRAAQDRYRIGAIRLLGDGGCAVVVLDQQNGREHILETAQAWDRLAAGPTPAAPR